MTSTPELPVPDAALDAMYVGPSEHRTPEQAVRAIAGPVVAAGLREEADLVASVSQTPEVAPNAGDIIQRLRARADELHPASTRLDAVTGPPSR